MKLRKIHLLAGAGLAAALLVCFLLFNSKPVGYTPQAAPVFVASARKGNIEEKIHTVGAVESFSTVEIKSRVEGEITEIFFAEGSFVKEGAPLFTIDPRPYTARVNEAKAILQRDQATLNKAREDLRRYSSLINKQAVSREEYEQAVANADALEATVRSDQAALASAQLQLEYCNIRAPISGRTGRILVHRGNIIQANADTPLVTIEQIRPVRVTFPVPELYLNRIRARMKSVELPVLARPPQSTFEPESGTLSFIDNAVNSPTGTILLKAIFANEDENLWPGQFVDVELRLDNIADAIIIPSEAIQQSQRGPYVYVVEPVRTEQGKTVHVAEMKLVTPGYSTERETVIVKGLSEGELVVTSGQIRLTPGTEVEILKPDPQPSGEAAAPGKA